METLIAQLTAAPAAFAWHTVLLRLAAACLCGALIGYERERRDKPAGLRTYTMVAAGACLFCLLTFEIMVEARIEAASDTVRTDPVRIIEAVTQGVAFLAAGTIFARGATIHGLTTGAGLWVAGAIGVACGIGQILLAALATAMVLAVLVVLRWLERSALHTKDPDEP